MAITESDLNNWFQHHPPKDDAAVARYQTIREAGRTFAQVIVEHTPPSADQTAAVRKVREAVMTANAAIACHVERAPDGQVP
jgi:hypothetical protein